MPRRMLSLLMAMDGWGNQGETLVPQAFPKEKAAAIKAIALDAGPSPHGHVGAGACCDGSPTGDSGDRGRAIVMGS